jgi:N-acetylglucosamine kinase-like BadF-type ATPase
MNENAGMRFSSCDRNTLVPYFLGIDGGGSKTSCLIGDEVSVLGRGTASGSNVVRVGEAAARKALEEAIHEACTSANISRETISHTVVGVAGGARPEVSEVVHRIVSEIAAGEVEVVGDMVVAMQAAFGDGPGVIVIAGTGSIAYGRNSEGKTARAGGWGFAISDEGSGHWIGLRAVAAAIRAIDEEKQTGLLESMLSLWRLENREELVMAANANPPRDFAGLFPVVVDAADAGDRAAGRVLEEAGKELAGLAEIVIRRLFGESQGIKIAMAGGVFANSRIVGESFCDHLITEYPTASIEQEVVEPVFGALELARKKRS